MKQPKVYIKYLNKVLEVESIRFDTKVVEVYDESRNMYQFSDFDDVIFMDNTGMQDKNGKYICIGDIVKEDDDIYTIKRSELCKIISMCNKRLNIFLGESVCREIEVIGNIYENKELLGNE